MQGPYQSPGKRTQWAVLAFPFINLSTNQKKVANSIPQDRKSHRACKVQETRNKLKSTYKHSRMMKVPSAEAHKDSKLATENKTDIMGEECTSQTD